MLRKFNGTYVGFQSKKKMGEIFDYENEKWVIIRILNMKLKTGKVPAITAEIIGQKVGKNIDYSQFYKEHTITDKLPLEGRKPWDKNMRQVGEVVSLLDEESGEKVLAQVTETKSFEYDYTDLIVEHQVTVIEPWNDEQMNKTIQANRLSTFKVIPGKKEVD